MEESDLQYKKRLAESIENLKKFHNATDEQISDFVKWSDYFAKKKIYSSWEEYEDIPPPTIDIIFDTDKIFGQTCSVSDRDVLSEILGSPVYKTTYHLGSQDPHLNSLYREVFDNLTVESYIKLVKAFTIRFRETFRPPARPVLSGRIYNRVSNINVKDIDSSIPNEIILEPVNLFIRLFNETGNYVLPPGYIAPNWENPRFLGGSRLYQLKKNIQCEITMINNSIDRYLVHIKDSSIFIHLIKKRCFIYQFFR